ncbi:ATP-binding protein [Kineococcus sp. SYSU DK003]|uniref:ATP-binding protein n=1 Tax=Kineococcus sp. SYSU DK003 TaxID=3383124 RepID=UPI003D7E2F00
MLEVRLFGVPDVRVDGVVVPLASGRALLLLARLLLRPEPQRREHLAQLLWPHSAPAQARTNLRHVVHTVRTTLPAAVLRSTATTLAWGEAETWVDVTAFTGLAGARDPDRLREGVALYTGDLLTGWDEEWVLTEREALRRKAVEALDRLAGLLAGRGDLAAAVSAAERARDLDPLTEEPYRRLIGLHEARGDRARALRAYHECAAVLREELGTEPSARTRAAYEALLPRGGRDERVPGTAPLVGRRPERRLLAELWARARGGAAQCAVVTGEPGIGKTRLVEELRAWAARRGATTATARSYPVEGAPAYGPVVEWLQALGSWRDALEPAALAVLARLVPGLPATAAPADEDPRRQLFDAVADALLAARGPVLLVADDVHAADRQTLAFVHHLLRTRPTAPLLLVATARLAETDPGDPLRGLLTALHALGRCTQLDLAPLDAAQVSTLATAVAGHEVDAATAARLATETAGNPLFVVEAVRAGWPGPGAPDVLVPPVRAVLQARLDQLSPGARDLVGLAATAGSSVPVEVLSALRPDDEDGLTRDLDELWRRGLLIAGGSTYDFSHDLLREVAVRSLEPARRRHDHVLLARALAGHDPDRRDAPAGRIAAHLHAAGRNAEAVAWYCRAAVAAQRVHADADAVDLLERAREAVRVSADAPSRDERELDVLVALSAPLAAVEGYGSPRLAAVLADATALGGALGREPAAPVLRALGMAALSRGDVDAALGFGERLHATSQDDLVAVEGHFLQGVATYWRGERTRSRRHLQAALARYRPQDRPVHLRSFAQDPQVLCLARLALLDLADGDPGTARRRRDEALALAHRGRHPFTLGAALLFAALLDLELADVEALRRHAHELTELLPHVQAPAVRLVAAGFEGHLRVVDGRSREGLAAIDAALADPGRLTAPGTPAMLLRIRLAACEVVGDRTGAGAAARALLAGDVRVWDELARTVLER